MRHRIIAAFVAAIFPAWTLAASDRPAWLPDRPDVFLAELIARGGRVVAVMPGTPPVRLQGESSSAAEAAPVVVFIQHEGKLVRCPDTWDWTDREGAPRRRIIVPGRCEVSIPRKGWPFTVPQPERQR